MTSTWCQPTFTLDSKNSKPCSSDWAERKNLSSLFQAVLVAAPNLFHSLTILGLAGHKEHQVTLSIPSLSLAHYFPGTNSWQSESSNCLSVAFRNSLEGVLKSFSSRSGDVMAGALPLRLFYE